MNAVVFEEEQGFKEIPRAEPVRPSLSGALLKAQIISGPGDAGVLLAITGVVLIGISFYLFASAVEPPPRLGTDRLIPGEAAPEYIQR